MSWTWAVGLLAVVFLLLDAHAVLAAAALAGAVVGWILGGARPHPPLCVLALACGLLGLATVDGPPLGGAPIERAVAWAVSTPVALWALGAGIAGRLAVGGAFLASLGAALPVVVAVERAGRSQTVAAGAVAAVLLGAGLVVLAARLPRQGRRALVGAAFLPALVFLVRGPASPGPYAHPADLPVRAAVEVELHVTDTALLSSVAALPDGRIAFGEFASGRVHVLDPSTGVTELRATVPLPPIHGARTNYELGLWGLAAATDGALFAMAVHRWDEADPSPQARSSRVVRIGRDGSIDDVATGLPAGPIHAGGALAFADDGSLYVAVGDGLSHGARGERVGTDPLAGTILRLPAGWSGSPTEAEVHARGFRNIYGMAFGADGGLWATENGPDCCDALFAVASGAFHGWPPAAGSAEVDPVWESGRQRLGPTGIVQLGATYGEAAGDLLFATWHTGALHRVRVDGTSVLEHEIVTVMPTSRPAGGPYRFAGAFTGLTRAPDGSVWFSTVNAVGRIVALAR